MSAMKTTPVLPPRKKDWKPGSYQLGLFVRFPDGDVVEISSFDSKVDEAESALALLKLLTRKADDRAEEPEASREVP